MEQELIVYFDQHFREVLRHTESLHEQTTQQIAGLRQETVEQIAGLRQETVEQIAGLRQETVEQIAGLRQETVEQIAGLRQETTEQIAGLRQETMEQIYHTQIMVEDMRGKLQILAEGYFGIQEKLTVFKDQVEENFKAVHNTLSVHYRGLESRIRIVEERTERKGRDPLDILREQYDKSGTG
jgi:hypothetical protein